MLLVPKTDLHALVGVSDTDELAKYRGYDPILNTMVYDLVDEATDGFCDLRRELVNFGDITVFETYSEDHYALRVDREDESSEMMAYDDDVRHVVHDLFAA